MKKLLCVMLIILLNSTLFAGDSELIERLLNQLSQESFVFSHPDENYSCTTTAQITEKQQNSNIYRINTQSRLQMDFRDGHLDTEEIETHDNGSLPFDQYRPAELQGNPINMNIQWDLENRDQSPMRFTLDRSENILRVKCLVNSQEAREWDRSTLWNGWITYDPETEIFTSAELTPAFQSSQVIESKLILETLEIDGRRCLSLMQMYMVYESAAGDPNPIVFNMTMEMDQYRWLR